MPRYLLSAHSVDGQAREPMTDEQMQHSWEEIQTLEAKMKSAGAWVFSGRLHDADTATVVRVSDGEIVTTDGIRELSSCRARTETPVYSFPKANEAAPPWRALEPSVREAVGGAWFNACSPAEAGLQGLRGDVPVGGQHGLPPAAGHRPPRLRR